MSTPLEHDYIGLAEASSMEKTSVEKLSSSSSSNSTLSTDHNTATTTTTTTTNNNNKSTCLDLKETELRLGLPGSKSPERKPTNGTGVVVSLFGKDIENNKSSKGFALTPLKNIVSGAKRGFSDAIDGSSGGNTWGLSMNAKLEADLCKGALLYSPRGGLDDKSKTIKEATVFPQSPKPVQEKKKIQLPASNEPTIAPAAKAQVVGWPPIRSFRKNTMASNVAKTSEDDAEGKSGSGCLYVKVSMDGAPYLRKVDLKTYSNYMELSSALEKMFSCFTLGQCDSNGLPGRDGLSETRLKDLLHGSEYVLTYEDKDNDWMLVGDVPWDMFTESCRRLRIMKGSEAIGLAPRAMEKCKNRN